MNIKNLSLPPGFRFHPTDQELIVHYLKKKVSSPQSPAVSIIADVDLYKYNPWQLPEMAFFGDGEWFFFSPRDRKYPNGARPNRAAASGYWKATGTDKPILTSGGSECIGVKKHLVFYTGRPPKGMKADWVMYEYRLLDNRPDSMKLSGSMRLDDWVLCRVRQKTNNPPHIEEKEEDRMEELSMNGDSLFEGIDHQMPPPYQLEKVDENVSMIENMNDVTSQQNEEGHSSLRQVLDSIKRNLSLGGLDEYMLLQPPSKRPNVNSSMDEFPPSDSVSSSFSEF